MSKNNEMNQEENLEHHLSRILSNDHQIGLGNVCSHLAEDVGRADELYRTAKSLHDEGDFQGAITQYQACLLIRELNLGKYHKLTIKTYWRLGRVNIRIKDHQAAILAFKRAYRMADSAFGSEHEITKSLLQDVAAFLRNNGLTNPKVRDYHSAILESRALERHGDTASRRELYTNARRYYKQAIRLEESLFGGNLDMADMTIKLANIEKMHGDPSAASSDYRKALRLYKIHLGEEHPAFVGAATNLRNSTQAEKKANGKRSFTSSFRKLVRVEYS
jgi:tetratricopeptide (TPR) repeat protein